MIIFSIGLEFTQKLTRGTDHDSKDFQLSVHRRQLKSLIDLHALNNTLTETYHMRTVRSLQNHFMRMSLILSDTDN